MNKKILLIEDEVNVVGFIKKGLSEEGFEVSVALDGNSGVDMAVKNNYDLMGNLNELQHMGDSNFTRIYYHTNNLLDAFEVDGQTYHYQYDVCGNQIQENEERNMQWDYADKLRLYYNQTSLGTEPSVYTHYLYDAGGNRVKKLTRTAGGNWETITYIDGIIEYRENDAGDYQSISHVMDDSKRIATIREGSDFGDTTPAIKYNLDDHLGSSNVLVDENGTLVNFEEYYPFGETSFGSYAKKRYRFCGKEKDSESGMYYYGARYYSPWLCRFINVDPKAGKYLFQIPYAYADNNPINKMDYNGEGTEEGGTPSDNKSQNTQNLNTKPDVIQVDPSLYAKAERIKPNQTKEEVQAEYDSSKKTEADKKTYDTKINQINEYNKLKDSIKRLETLKSDLMKAESGPLAVVRDEVIKNGATVFLTIGNNLTDGKSRLGAITTLLDKNDPNGAFVVAFDFDYIDANPKSEAIRSMELNNPFQMDLSQFKNRDTSLLAHELAHVYFNFNNPEKYNSKVLHDKSEDYAQDVEQMQLMFEIKGTNYSKGRILNGGKRQ